jgi:hypothetical protein
VRTGEDNGFTSEDFTVARVKRRILAQSYVGTIYTRRDPLIDGSEARQTAGLDMSLSTSSFRGSQNLEAAAWFLHATRPDASGGNSAFGASLDYPNDRWNARFDATEIQEHFDPSIGFVRRRNFRKYSPTIGFQPRPENSRLVRQYALAASADVLTDLDNDLLTRQIDVMPVRVNFQSQDNFNVNVINYRERLDTPFAITRDITLPLGAVYDFTRYRFFVSTAQRRKVAINSRFERGGFYAGTRRDWAFNLSVRVRPGLFVFLNPQWNDIRLPEGNFKTTLYRFTTEAQFNPFIALVNNIQYDSQSAVLGWQSRFRWILTPGNDLYLVYTHNWLDDPLLSRFSTLDKRFSSKILYTYRF